MMPKNSLTSCSVQCQVKSSQQSLPGFRSGYEAVLGEFGTQRTRKVTWPTTAASNYASKDGCIKELVTYLFRDSISTVTLVKWPPLPPTRLDVKTERGWVCFCEYNHFNYLRGHDFLQVLINLHRQVTVEDVDRAPALPCRYADRLRRSAIAKELERIAQKVPVYESHQTESSLHAIDR